MRHRPDGEISDSKTEAKETKKLAGDAPFRHVEPLGFHLLPGVPSSIIAKIKTIWPSARHPPTLAFFQPPRRTGSSGRESGERSPQGLRHLSRWPLLQLGQLGLEPGRRAWQGLFPSSSLCHLHSI